MGFFGFSDKEPELDDADSWADATAAYRAGLATARQWQPDARTALTEATEYPPAHINNEGEWEIYYWSTTGVKGLLLFLDEGLGLLRQEEWGSFYRDVAVRVGTEFLDPHGFSYTQEVSQPGPEGLSFVFRKSNPVGLTQFVDVQISTSVMLTPPPRRFTINLVQNPGERPLFGASGGFEARLSAILPNAKPDFWWSFKDESEYEARLREAFSQTVEYGLPAFRN